MMSYKSWMQFIKRDKQSLSSLSDASRNAFNFVRLKAILGTRQYLPRAELFITDIKELSDKLFPALSGARRTKEDGAHVKGNTGIHPRAAPLERFV